MISGQQFFSSIYFELFFLFSTLVFFQVTTASDSGLELVHADKQVTREINGELLNVFEGNVHFRQDTLEMFCQNAVLNEQKNRLEFSGNVLITDSHSRLNAKKIDYYTKTQMAYCYDLVRIKTPTDTLYSEYLRYNFKTDEAEARKNIYIFNLENDVQIWGQEGSYDPIKKMNIIREQARFAKADTSSGDTLNITADQLKYFGGDVKTAVATDSVVITQGALRAVCDSAVYITDTEIVSLFGRPNAWYEDSELSGKYMQAQFDSLKLKEIIATEDAKAVSLVDSLSGKKNILTGNKILFKVENNHPEHVIAMDNATSIYYLQTEEKKGQGCNYATSDTIQVYFFEGKLDSIAIKGGSEGIYYPEEYKDKKVFENE